MKLETRAKVKKQFSLLKDIELLETEIKYIDNTMMNSSLLSPPYMVKLHYSEVIVAQVVPTLPMLHLIRSELNTKLNEKLKELEDVVV